jgi:hypothetical protein
MKTRCFAVICLAVVSSGTLGSQVAPTRPNIVYILADDQAATSKLKPRDPTFKTPKVWGER